MNEQSRSATICTAICIWVLIHAGVAHAGPVTGLNTFTPNTDATAQSVNDNFSAVKSAVDDNHTRITNNAASSVNNFSSITANTTNITDNFANLDQRISSSQMDFSGYWVGFPAEGQPSNVLLLGSYDFEDNLTGYSIRSGSNGSGGGISVNGVLTPRQYIFHYSFVGVDPDGTTINFISDYIESPDTEEYLTYLIEESTFDLVSLVKTIEPDGDTLRGTESCGFSVVQICVFQLSISATGDFVSLGDYSRGRVLATNVNIGGGWPVFTDVRLEKNFSGGRLRIRAKGIGTVYENFDDGRYNRLLYHRNDGTAGTGGSLAGTPFESGAALDSLFFVP